MGPQQAQRKILELIPKLRAKPTSGTVAPVAEPISDEPAQRATLTNADNLSTIRQLGSIVEEPATLLTLFDIEALIKQKKGSTTTINWKPPRPVEVTTTPYPSDYLVPKFQKYDGRSENSKEHVMRFLE